MTAPKMTEDDLLKAGLAVDPSTGTIETLANLENQQPSATWDLEQLGQYVRTELVQVDNLDAKAVQLGRQSTIHLFRAGHALSLIK